MKFAVIGGDARIVSVSRRLAADGHEVKCFANDEADPALMAKTPEEALKNAGYIILPLPAKDNEGRLNAPLSASCCVLERILEEAEPGTVVFAGMADASLRQKAQERGLCFYDYFAREELTVANAAVTAEGAIQIAMEELPVTVCGTKTLICGFGRLGKLCAHRFAALGAKIAVSARKPEDKAWIQAYGYRAEDSGALSGKLADCGLIINTVPARIFDESLLSQIDRDCLCIDLASKPGGFDFQAASEIGVKVIWALSLPGKVAPVSAGGIIKDCIYNILKERGELI